MWLSFSESMYHALELLTQICVISSFEGFFDIPLHVYYTNFVLKNPFWFKIIKTCIHFYFSTFGIKVFCSFLPVHPSQKNSMLNLLWFIFCFIFVHNFSLSISDMLRFFNHKLSEIQEYLIFHVLKVISFLLQKSDPDKNVCCIIFDKCLIVKCNSNPFL